jgi:hypothetical protein
VILFISFAGYNPDLQNYRSLYVDSDLDTVYSFGIEPLYYISTLISKNFNLSFDFFYGVIVYVIVYSKIRIIESESRNKILAVFIYLTSVWILFDFIAIRQGAAMSIAMYSLIRVKSLPQRYLLILTASLFHFSAVILFLILLVRRLLNNPGLYKVLASLIIIISIFNIDIGVLKNLDIFNSLGIISEKVEIYSSQEYERVVSYKNIVIIAIMSYFYWENKIKNGYLFEVYLIGLVFCMLLGDIPMISYRMKWYFLLLESVIIGGISIQKNATHVFMIAIIVVLNISSSVHLMESLYERVL